MYQFSYADIQTDSVADARDRERQLLTRSIDLLATASTKGVSSLEAIEEFKILRNSYGPEFSRPASAVGMPYGKSRDGNRLQRIGYGSGPATDTAP